MATGRTAQEIAKTIEVGDWVCFVANGTMQIGEVRYIVLDGVLNDDFTFFTMAGAFKATQILPILEIRKKS